MSNGLPARPSAASSLRGHQQASGGRAATQSSQTPPGLTTTVPPFVKQFETGDVIPVSDLRGITQAIKNTWKDFEAFECIYTLKPHPNAVKAWMAGRDTEPEDAPFVANNRMLPIIRLRPMDLSKPYELSGTGEAYLEIDTMTNTAQLDGRLLSARSSRRVSGNAYGALRRDESRWKTLGVPSGNYRAVDVASLLGKRVLHAIAVPGQAVRFPEVLLHSETYYITNTYRKQRSRGWVIVMARPSPSSTPTTTSVASLAIKTSLKAKFWRDDWIPGGVETGAIIRNTASGTSRYTVPSKEQLRDKSFVIYEFSCQIKNSRPRPASWRWIDLRAAVFPVAGYAGEKLTDYE